MSRPKLVRVPHDRLNPETLHAVITEFVTREGTEYGEREFSLEEKIKSVQAQLRRGSAVLVFNSTTESTTFVPADDPELLRSERGDSDLDEDPDPSRRE